MTVPVYETSHIKRHRSTKAEVERRRSALYEIVRQGRPMTVRQVFYQATVRGIVDKLESDCNKVTIDLGIMRKSGAMPFGWLTDGTRWQRRPTTFGSVDEALRDTAQLYRRALWRDADCRVELWLEKDALSGVIYPVTSLYDVPLMVTRGYASLSFLYGAAEEIAEEDRPTYIYHCGDFDPSGVNAGEKIEETLKEMAPDAEIHFERIAVTPDQIRNLNLPTRPTKQTDTRAKKFGAISVELDAINPQELRWIVEQAIVRHLPREKMDVLRAAEQSERQLLRGLVGLGGERPA